MKNKKLLSITGSICLTLILMIFLLPAWAREAPLPVPASTPTPALAQTPTPPPTPAPKKYQWPTTLSISTAQEGSSDHGAIAGLGQVLQKDTGMKVRIMPIPNETQRTHAGFQGLINITAQSAHMIPTFYMGLDGAELTLPKKPVQVIMHIADSFTGLYVMADSPIKTIYDLKQLKGIRLPLLAPNPPVVIRYKQGFPAFIGMTPEEAEKHFTYVPIGSTKGWEYCVVEGRCDICQVSLAGSMAYEIAANPRGIRIIELPQSNKEGWKKLAEISIGGCIPGVCEYGIKGALGKEVFKQMKVMSVSTDTDQEIVYHFVKWFYSPDKQKLYQPTHVLLEHTSLDSFRKFLNVNCLPVAPGAIRYLREVGLWTAQDEKLNQENVDLMDRYCKAWTSAASEANNKGIKIDANNQQWVNLLRSWQKDLPKMSWRL